MEATSSGPTAAARASRSSSPTTLPRRGTLSSPGRRETCLLAAEEHDRPEVGEALADPRELLDLLPVLDERDTALAVVEKVGAVAGRARRVIPTVTAPLPAIPSSVTGPTRAASRSGIATRSPA